LKQSRQNENGWFFRIEPAMITIRMKGCAIFLDGARAEETATVAETLYSYGGGMYKLFGFSE
jgi:hypothetical protein